MTVFRCYAVEFVSADYDYNCMAANATQMVGAVDWGNALNSTTLDRYFGFETVFRSDRKRYTATCV